MTVNFKQMMLKTKDWAGVVKSLVSCLMLLLAGWSISAQTVSGTVSSDKDGTPLIGASVLEKGTGNGTITDIDGNFSLKLTKVPAVLEVSYIGYGTMTYDVAGAQSGMAISLSEGTAIEEIVVTALGIERKSKNLTYSVQKIDGGQINTIRDANFVNTLNGKVAGLVVTTGAGGPGAASRVVLRGNRSISGSNNAMFVVDGVPIDNSNRGQAGNDFGGYNTSDGAANINPDDIDNISVLKGAAAAALYGSRAANGVILITTKKGKSGKISVDFNGGVTSESPMLLPSLQNTYTQGNGGKSNTTSSGSWGGQGATFSNNVSDFFRNAFSTNASVAVSGGTDKTQAYFSFTNARSQGIVPGNDLQRNTLNLRINNQITDRLSLDSRITYTKQNIENRIKIGEEGGTVMNLYKIPRSVDLATYNDEINSTTDKPNFENADGTPKYWTTSSIYMNPYWTVNRMLNNEDRNRVNFLSSLTYKLTDNINIMGRVSLDGYNDKEWFKFYDGTLLFAQQGGSYSEGFSDVKENNFDLLITGKSDLGSKLRLDYNIGTALNQRSIKYSRTSANGLLVPNQFFTGFGRNIGAEGIDESRELQSVYGTASLAYNDYLIFDLTARNDWSSTLPAPHSFFYPSVGVTAILSDMVTMPEAINFAKLRGSWTQVGNDAPTAVLTQLYSLSQGGSGGLISRDGLKAIADLKPELTSSLEFGLDLRMFSNRMGLDLTWYKTNSINQLIRIPLPTPSGFSESYINAGDIQNTGIEASLSYKVLNTDKAYYKATVNYARNRNEVIELSDQVKETFLSGGFGRTAGVLAREGAPYGELYAEGWKRDAQGRYLVDAKGLPIGSGAGKTLVGNFNPDFTLALNNELRFGNINIGLLIDGRFGGVVTSGSDQNLAFDGNADYTTAGRDGSILLDAVTESGEKNTQKISAEQLWTTVSQGRYAWGEFFTYDATNVRIRELSLGYNFPLSGNGTFKNLTVSLIGRNLLFLYRGNAILDLPGIPTRKLNFDPDIMLGAGNFQGVEYGNVPSTRSIGVNFKFGF